MNKSAKQLQRFKKFPNGLWLMSRALCLKAPYFASIRPTFIILEPGKGEAVAKKRRAIKNHLGTVHAIAMANLCEFVAGVTLEMTLPESHRWIPKSMKISYLAKADSDIRARTSIVLPSSLEGSMNVTVNVTDAREKLVATAEIEMHLSKRK